LRLALEEKSMSVRRRKWRDPSTGALREVWMVDIVFQHADGREQRVRRISPVQTRRGGEAYERQLRASLLTPRPNEKEAPVLSDFMNRYMEGYVKANRLKASSVAAKKSIFETHLVPMLGSRRLDRITDEDVQRLKAKLSDRSRKTVNNVLTVLCNVLRVAVKWKVISAMPCSFEFYRVSNVVPEFYEFEDYERLVDAAARIDACTHIAVLLGGDAGLRRGEIGALRQSDVDLRRRQLRVEQSDWKGVIDTPKGGRGRVVPMTEALFEALTKNRHLRGDLVLTLDDGRPVPGHTLRTWMERAQRRAGLRATGKVHILRHTFCSHLAMRGAPAKAIQDLAGHQHLSTTMRYMHLSPSERERAIGLLNGRRAHGTMAAHGDAASATS
jgi:integrase